MESVLKFVKEQDFFATPVQLTYKSKTEFNTAFGGFCSIFLFLGMTIYLAVHLID